MILETASILGASVLLVKATLAKQGSNNDSDVIQDVFNITGLNVKHEGGTYTTQLVRRKHYEWGVEYKYRMPRGREFKEYQAKLGVLQAALSSKGAKITAKDVLQLKLDKDIVDHYKKLRKKKMNANKEVEMSEDGFLIIRVYDYPLPNEIPFTQSDGWKVNIGQTRQKDEMIVHNFEHIPHLAIGGATRYGKSNLINSMITSLLLSKPKHVKLHLIDLKGGIELSDYENIAQTVSIAYEPEQALKTLEKAYEVMKETQRRLKDQGKKKVQESTIKERHFVIIDEVGELNPLEAVDKDEKALKLKCQKIMSQIARLGAGLGFRLIVATQYGTADIIPRQVKQNCDAKISFRVSTSIASQVALDTAGAESLPDIKGRAIYQSGKGHFVLQTPLIDSQTIIDAIEPHIIEKEVEPIETTDRETRKDPVEFIKS